MKRWINFLVCLFGVFISVIFFSRLLCAQSKSMDVLNVGLYADLSSFDPHLATTAEMDKHVLHIYEGLVKISYDDPNDFSPVLATSWTASDDGLTYIFNLRKGVKFTDGTDFNANAAKFSFDRIMALKKGGAYSLMETVESVTVKGEYTIEIRLKSRGPLLSFLVNAYMVSPTAIKNHSTKEDPWAEKWLINHSVGTARYQLAEWTKGVRYKLVENPVHWDKWGKHFKAVVGHVIYEADVQRMMLERGDLDIAMNLPFDALPSLKRNPDVRIHENAGGAILFLFLNHIAEPTKHLLVRKALAHAWNHKAFSIVRRGLAPRADGFCPNAMLGKGYKPPAPYPYEYDLNKAKEYLIKAGYPDGFTINFMTQKGDEEKNMLFDVYQNDLAKLGIKVKL